MLHSVLLLSTIAAVAAEQCEGSSDTNELMQHPNKHKKAHRPAHTFESGTQICFADLCVSPSDAPLFDWKTGWNSFLHSEGSEGRLGLDPLQGCCESCDAVATCSNSEKEEHILVEHILPFMLPPAKEKPVFLELGGMDGWHETNTYFLEKCLGWKGMLIEANPENFKNLHRNRPNALKISSAICTNTSRVVFGSARAAGRILNNHPRHLSEEDTLPCSPLQAFFDVLGVGQVTVFSLDVEGFEPWWGYQELSVLESVNWHRVKVGALVVEELQLDRDQQKNKDVRRLLKETAKLEMLGVSCWKEVACDSYWINPLLFDHEAAKAYLRRHPFPSEKYRVKPETACSKASKTVL
ncbi:unnamed protein product [Symbiodinium natans]|uniref:Methyltransferase FkbM domain-containing protein n=1 Tax=Symbiodinium natans TaxID=878477 RepID=A0A812JKG5_9DINO|nr:unnamed protein product [Symbiodinium natans]